ncbi:unnamed protein product, partial [Rotaria sp. Silwood1]
MQVMSLEEAVESIAELDPSIINDAKQAKVECRKDTALSPNESAAIYLYTMPTPFYAALNGILRSENSQAAQS